jgi:diguanylate cyclase (GGDEF)-like protein/PAS domain S-box-containing protein
MSLTAQENGTSALPPEVLALTPQPTVATDREGRILRCNAAMGQVMGRPVSTLTGRLLSEFLAPGSQAALAELLSLSTGVANIELRREDNVLTRLNAQARRVSLLDGLSVVVIGFANPAQSADAQAARELAVIFDNALIGIVFIRNRIIERCNRRAEELFGYGHGEMSGLSTRAWYDSEDDWLDLGKRGYSSQASDGHFELNLHFRRKDGSHFWARSIGHPLNPREPIRDGTIWLYEDISARLAAEEQLAGTLSLQQAILDGANLLVISTGIDGSIRTFNRGAERMLGYRADELVGRATPALFHDPAEIVERAAELSAEMNRPIEPGFEVFAARPRAGEVEEREWTLIGKNGRRVPVQLTISALVGNSGEITGYVGVATDITERRKAQQILMQAKDELEQRVHSRTIELVLANTMLQSEIRERKQIEERIRHMAHHDALTDLPNRTLLHDRLSQALAMAERHKHLVGVLFIDLDRFKTINDSLGHAIGDRLIIEVAHRLRASVRAGDTVARQGGDEFVVVLPKVEDVSEARTVAEKLLIALEPFFGVEGHELHVAASIGVCLYPEDGRDVETLMRNADTAMYQAKATGRNRIQFFAQNMNVAAEHFFRIEHSLRRALERKELELWYQPILDIATRRPQAVEALLRWHHPELGLVGPDRFIEVAEESNLILPIGEWVLREACQQARRWRDAGLPPVPVAVNISARQFHQSNLVRTVTSALEDARLPGAALEIEITESTLMQDRASDLATLRALDELGIALVVDDFGIGYSSLAYLKRFPVKKIKIDQQFVRDILVDADDAAIVRAILALARALKLRAVAEGVTDVEQLAFLQQEGCDEAQGYLFSTALVAAGIQAYLQAFTLNAA